MSAAAFARPKRRDAHVDAAGFSHEAVLYNGAADFLTRTLPFVQEGLDGDEAVLVVVDAGKIARMREALGADADRVQFADMDAVGLNPARIIPAWQDFVSEHGTEGCALRGIGEPISASRTADQLIECQRHESLLNVAFAGTSPWRLLCPYDVTALSPVVIDEALRSHPFVLDDGLPTPSAAYRGLDASAAPFDAGLPPPAEPVMTHEFDVDSLSDVRRVVKTHARDAGLADGDASDLALAVHEIAANSARHGGGNGVLTLTGATRGRGLWLANHLCDLVQIRSLPTGGVVRLHKFRTR
jgi:hypothetical protein